MSQTRERQSGPRKMGRRMTSSDYRFVYCLALYCGTTHKGAQSVLNYFIKTWNE